MNKNYHQILGVPPSASPSQIRQAYLDNAIRYHPDKNRDNDATQKYKEILEAYRVLTGQIVESYENGPFLGRLTTALTRVWFSSLWARKYSSPKAQFQCQESMVPNFSGNVLISQQRVGMKCSKCKNFEVTHVNKCGHIFCSNCESTLNFTCSECDVEVSVTPMKFN